MRTELKSVETNIKNELLEKSDSIAGMIDSKSADLLDKIESESATLNSKIESKFAEISLAMDDKAKELINSHSDQDKKLKDIAAAITEVKAEENKTQNQIVLLIKHQKATNIIAIITMILVILGVAALKFV